VPVVPWFCPACRTEIRHSQQDVPHDGRTYRCDLCRLELTFDGFSNRMRVPSYEADPVLRPYFERREEAERAWNQDERRRRERRRNRSVA